MGEPHRVTNRELLDHLEKAAPNAQMIGRLAQSVETLMLETRQTSAVIRTQGETLAVLRSKMDNGVFVRKERLATAIGDVVAAHMASCPGAAFQETLDRMRDEGRQTWRDRATGIALLLRSIATAASILGGIGAARAIGFI